VTKRADKQFRHLICRARLAIQACAGKTIPLAIHPSTLDCHGVRPRSR